MNDVVLLTFLKGMYHVLTLRLKIGLFIILFAIIVVEHGLYPEWLTGYGS